MSPKQGREWTFKAIIKADDNWSNYQEAYKNQVTVDQIKEVEKMLDCGEPKKGFATYLCLASASSRLNFRVDTRLKHPNF